MGRSGIRRRKPYHHLPKVRDEDLPTDNDLIPPMMWPAKGSGFEASPFSPAGSQQRQWWFLVGARRRTQDRERSPQARAAGWFAIAIIGIPAAIAVLAQVLHMFR